jgi:hypothetical protein
MRQTMKESVEYFRKKPWRVPDGVILAFSEAHPVNEVLINGTLRYRITREITREEFMEQLRKNKLQPNYSSAVAPANGAKILAAESTEMDGPDEEFTHFYRAECI